MIPLRDENPSKRIPFVNVFLIIISLLFFIYQFFVYSGGPSVLFLGLGSIPYEFTHFKDIDPPGLIPVPLTFITSMFMHAGLIHLIGNMLFLWVFGPRVEERLGHRNYLIFYLLCGTGAFLLNMSVNFNSRVPSIGASGAIAGVMGAYMYLYPGARIKTLVIWFVFIQVIRIPAVILLGYWILIQIVSGLAEFRSRSAGGIAWFAHVGGFITGLLLIIAMKRRNRK